MAICRMKELEQEQPAVAMTAEDGADLRRCRRGIESLRIVIMPQQDQRATTLPVIELLRILVRCCRPDDGVRRAMQPQPPFPRSGLPYPEPSAFVDRRGDHPDQGDRVVVEVVMLKVELARHAYGRWHPLQRIQQTVGSVTISSWRRGVGRRRWIADW